MYDAEEDMLKGLETAKSKGDVVVIRYEDYKGGPGVPEILTPTSAIYGRMSAWPRRGADYADGRFPAVPRLHHRPRGAGGWEGRGRSRR